MASSEGPSASAAEGADASTLPKVPIGKEIAPGLAPSAVIKGCWQLAGGHRGDRSTDRTTGKAAVEDFQPFVNAGITTFDTADIYGPSESLIGDYLRKTKDRPPVQVFTKCCFFGSSQQNVSLQAVEQKIDLSRQHLGVDSLDLVQMYWQDYSVRNYVKAAQALQALQEKGKIRAVAVTNLATKQLEEMVSAGVKIAANQVQYSLLDRRPENGLVDFCQKHDISLLPFGTVGGGFLTDKYLGVSADQASKTINTYSLQKYANTLGRVGSWDWLQELLTCLRSIADKHSTDVANVSSKWVLQRPTVAAIIIGARNANHVEDHRRLFTFELDGEDLATIDVVLAKGRKPQGDVSVS
ncbi:oxidoreductase [Klebsormidium nitens]|uniref:Oxidoreductase n=1 Tax=Klebsormidium nitens TaxID=105231 RepID=A0A1Y1HUS5_KLENI|nr:oxidoreductase [Klebsormidium nitens]|eukprot:GAQ82385.1 oxidoreductase [Klebsormidium nitens]